MGILLIERLQLISVAEIISGESPVEVFCSLIIVDALGVEIVYKSADADTAVDIPANSPCRRS